MSSGWEGLSASEATVGEICQDCWFSIRPDLSFQEHQKEGTGRLCQAVTSYHKTICDFVYDSGLAQLVDEPTHEKGNVLDLVLTNIQFLK